MTKTYESIVLIILTNNVASSVVIANRLPSGDKVACCRTYPEPTCRPPTVTHGACAFTYSCRHCEGSWTLIGSSHNQSNIARKACVLSYERARVPTLWSIKPNESDARCGHGRRQCLESIATSHVFALLRRVTVCPGGHGPWFRGTLCAVYGFIFEQILIRKSQ